MLNQIVMFSITLTLWVGVFVIVAFMLSRYDICFTQLEEGVAKGVMRGETLDHFLMHWKGHYLYDPRRSYYDPRYPKWEMYKLSDSNSHISSYAWWQIHWRFFERWGVYWYGLYPFKKIYVYRFIWNEHHIGTDGKEGSLYRDENTDFIFVKPFAYWIKLREARDKNNLPLDLDYLLTVRINNPYKALFDIDDWLGRATADANNEAKVHVGGSSIEELRTERSSQRGASQFVLHMLNISANTSTRYGVTLDAVSLVNVIPTSETDEAAASDEVKKALVAKRTAELNAAAAVETAKGEAQATREVAKGNADAIKTVYDQVKDYGEMGVILQGLDALKTAEKSPGTTIIWAQNPLGGIADAVHGLMKSAQPKQTPPTATTSTS